MLQYQIQEKKPELSRNFSHHNDVSLREECLTDKQTSKQKKSRSELKRRRKEKETLDN